MNKALAKILAMIFGLLSLGGALKIFRIMTSNAPDTTNISDYYVVDDIRNHAQLNPIFLEKSKGLKAS